LVISPQGSETLASLLQKDHTPHTPPDNTPNTPPPSSHFTHSDLLLQGDGEQSKAGQVEGQVEREAGGGERVSSVSVAPDLQAREAARARARILKSALYR
jgi:hypothetical protein